MFLPRKACLAVRRGYFAPPVVIILALITFGVALVIFFNRELILKSKSNQLAPAPVTQQRPKVSPNPSPADETANWKLYTDDNLGFSIKYPTEISIRRTLSEGGVEFGKAKDLQKDFRQVNMLAVYKRGEPGNDPETAFRSSECPKPCSEKTQKVSINNATGIKTLGPGYPFEHNYYLANQNKTSKVVRLFLFKNNLDTDMDTKVFEKMIATFHFLD